MQMVEGLVAGLSVRDRVQDRAHPALRGLGDRVLVRVGYSSDIYVAGYRGVEGQAGNGIVRL